MNDLQKPQTPRGNHEIDELREPSPDFVARVLDAVRAIPPGRVMTYGDVASKLQTHADLADTTGSYGARLVGQVMSRFGADVAWWRVLRSTGHPPKFFETRALPHYQEERTPLTGPEEHYRIDLKLARYDPDKDDEPRQATIALE